MDCNHLHTVIFSDHGNKKRCGRCGEHIEFDATGGVVGSQVTTPTPKGVEPREYQLEAVAALRAGLLRNLKRLMLCAPTGSGKTIIAIYMAHRALEKGSRVLFVADRIALVNQAMREFGNAGIDVGRIQGQTERNMMAPVQIAMSQTLERMPDDELLEFLSEFQLVVSDEAHRKRKKFNAALRASDCTAIGLSATPITSGLSETWQEVVMVRTTRSLIADGWLIEPIVYCAHEPELRDDKANSNGEWSSRYVANQSRALVGDVVTTWEQRCKEHFGGPVPTLVFSSTIEHGKELQEEFKAAGYEFEQTTGNDRDEQSERAIARYESGEVIGLISVDKLVNGFDAPQTQCLVIARPLRRSLALHIQMLGRAMRIAEGKIKAIVLDHAGNCSGFRDAVEEFWTNGIKELPQEAVRPVRANKRERKERTCVKCGAMLVPGKDECVACGHVRPKREVASEPGELTEMEHKDPWPDIELLALERFPTADQDPHAKTRADKWARAQYRNLTQRWTRRAVNPSAERRNIDNGIRARVRKAFQAWIIKQRYKNQETA